MLVTRREQSVLYLLFFIGMLFFMLRNYIAMTRSLRYVPVELLADEF